MDISKTKRVNIYCLILFVIISEPICGQIQLTSLDSVQIIIHSEKIIEQYQRLLNTITTASDEEAREAIIYSYTASSDIRRIFISNNCIVENDLDSSYYYNKKRGLAIDDYLSRFWAENGNAGKQIAYMSGIICDSIFSRGDSIISVVYFNTIFDKNPCLISKHKAHITCKKINDKWEIYVYEILLNEFDPFKNDVINKFANQEIKNTKPFLIPESEPLYYFNYRYLPNLTALSEIQLIDINSKIIEAESLYSNFLYTDALKKYLKITGLTANDGFIKKRINNCLLMSDILFTQSSLYGLEYHYINAHKNRFIIGPEYGYPMGKFSTGEKFPNGLIIYPGNYFGVGLFLRYELPLGENISLPFTG